MAIKSGKTADALIVASFCCIVVLAMVGTFLKEGLPRIHVEENRVLAPAPSLDDLTAPLELPKVISSYVADNFGFRQYLLWAYFYLRTRVLHSDLGLHAIEGKDGWLFIDWELPDYQRSQKLSPAQLKAIRLRLDAWCRYGLTIGARTLLLVGPNKSTIYPEMMPDYLPSPGGMSRMDQVYDLAFECPLILVDPRERLIAARGELLYYKWGTHWNDRAAIEVWQQMISQLTAEGVDRAWLPTRPVVSSRPARPNEDSIWAWYGADDPEVVPLPKVDFVPVPSSQAKGQPALPAPRLLGIGDSFLQFMSFTAAGYFASYELILPETAFSVGPKLAQLNALLFSRRQDFDVGETLKAFNPNLIMLEVVERNIATLADYVLPPGSYELFNVTNARWIAGIGSGGDAKRAVIVKPKDGSMLRVGDIVEFAKTGSVRITAITEVLPRRYTIIVDKPLDIADGYPNLVSMKSPVTTAD